jgi:hypothetical protein
MCVTSQAARYLPNEVRDLAERLGVNADDPVSLVRLTQAGAMRNQPSGRFMSFSAVQTICLQGTDFEWSACIGPFGIIDVIDAFKDGKARLEARALGFIPLTKARGEPQATKGEIMRYLAELACARRDPQERNAPTARREPSDAFSRR